MYFDNLKLYHSPNSPNSRRMRMFLAEKELALPLIAVDSARGSNTPMPTAPSTRSALAIRSQSHSWTSPLEFEVKRAAAVSYILPRGMSVD
jgi:hypothetical protein